MKKVSVFVIALLVSCGSYANERCKNMIAGSIAGAIERDQLADVNELVADVLIADEECLQWAQENYFPDGEEVVLDLPLACPGRYDVILEGQKYPLGSPIDLRKVTGATDLKKGLSKGVFATNFGCVQRGDVLRAHNGVDFGGSKEFFGTPVYSTADGIVSMVKVADGVAGNVVKIEHADGYITTYIHLDTVNVAVGDRVGAGCPIGTLGYTNVKEKGKSALKKMSSLHYEIHLKNGAETANVNGVAIKHQRHSGKQCEFKKTDALDPRPFVMAHGNIPLN